MTFLISLLTARGLTERAARIISYAGLALLLLGAFAGLVAAYNHHVIAAHDAKQVKAAEKATDEAATQRAKDAIKQAKHEEELHNAVHSVPDAPPAGPSHALACRRLHDLGRDPPACR